MDTIKCFGFVVFLGLSTLAFITHGVCVMDQPILQLHKVSLAYCARRCNCVQNCQYVGYHGMMAICELFESHPNVSDKKCSGYSLLNISNAKPSTPLHQQKCSLDDTIVCPEIKANNGNYLGNTNYLGSARILVCKYGYKADGLTATECTADGKWSEHGTCKRACRSLEQKRRNIVVTQIKVNTSAGEKIYDSVENMTTPFFENTTVSFTCGNANLLQGQSIMTCSNGSWNQNTSCGSRIREPCATDSECVDINSTCTNGTCWCKEELSYDQCSSACVETCPGRYGDTFQRVEANCRTFKDWNEVKKTNLANMTQCKTYCLEYSNDDFTCQSAYFDTNRSTNRCYLRNESNFLKNKFRYVNVTCVRRDCFTCNGILDP